jgi:diguanylate cyclase (GGDEF)-like protein
MYEFERKKILYIEDDQESRDMMADILRIHGFEFREASRGLEGIRIATLEKPDLILMDLNLPDMNGYEITTLIKSISILKETPVIALSADAKRDARELTLTAGCDGFIEKPINIAEFLKLLNEYLSGKRELIQPEVEQKYLSEYNIKLGEKLHDKIEELEKVNKNLVSINEELNNSRQQQTDYNNRLFIMNSLANSLRIQSSPDDILQILPQKMTEGFQLDRVIIFEYQSKGGKLTQLYHTGFEDGELKNIKLALDHVFYLNLKNEIKVLWVKNQAEIVNKSLLKMSQKLKSGSFLLGSISAFASHQDATGIFNSITSISESQRENQKIMTSQKKLLIYLDRKSRHESFLTYEIRVIKSFLHTASIIYENMNLYHNLLEILHIKEQQAITDPITGVNNHRYFRIQIESEIGRAQRHKKVFSIVMIDVDNFKEYNDTQGHLNGDLALKLVADGLLKNIRKSDVLARYGGDEFIIILPELDKEKAKKMAEKLCEVISKTKLPTKKFAPKVNLTISLGVATYPEDGDVEEKLLKKADEALYQAKDSGRNTVCIQMVISTVSSCKDLCAPGNKIPTE